MFWGEDSPGQDDYWADANSCEDHWVSAETEPIFNSLLVLVFYQQKCSKTSVLLA